MLNYYLKDMMLKALVGLSKSGLQYASEEPTEWVLVERIANEGCSATFIPQVNLRVPAGQICPQSGNWWSPANQSQSRYFNQGEIFPKIQSDWGETIWYLEETNLLN